jgi:uncharacterized protein YndB with AHSA1/START domain
MPTFELTRVIRRSPADVFDFVSDLRNLPRWQSGIERLEVVPDAPPRVGTAVRERRVVQGRRVDLAYRVMRLDPGRLLHVEGSEGPVRYRAIQAVAPEGEDSTRLSVRVEVELSGAMRFLAGLVAPAIQRQAAADLEHLAALLEQPAQGDQQR